MRKVAVVGCSSVTVRDVLGHLSRVLSGNSETVRLEWPEPLITSAVAFNGQRVDGVVLGIVVSGQAKGITGEGDIVIEVTDSVATYTLTVLQYVNGLLGALQD